MTATATAVRAPSPFLYSRGLPGWLAGLWLACGIALVAMIPPQLMVGLPFWKVSLSRIVLGLLLAAPLFAALLADRQRDASGRIRWLAVLAITAASFVPILLYTAVIVPGPPPVVLLPSMIVASIVVLLPLLVGKRHIGKAALLAGAAVILMVLAGVAFKNTSQWTFAALTTRAKGPETVVRAVPTALHTLRVSSYRGYIDAKVAGGGIAALGGGYLAASGEGALFFVERDADGARFAARRLQTTVPINHEQFFSETTQTGTSLAENNRVAIAPTWFRVADLLTEESDGTANVFAAHNYWKSAEKCSVLRVSMLSMPVQALVSNAVAASWKTIYETTPCQPLTNEGQGGRLVRLPDGALLLSVGVHDESNSPNAQNPASHYGKTIRIDTTTGLAEVFTSGHRNPQGLAVSSNGDIWQTEHGPRGGDELNRLVRGANLGWPQVSYGLPYFPKAPPFGDAGSHEGFAPPAFAWIPSIGISNLVEVTGDRFPHWNHDLLIASLVRTTLWRARVVDQRVTYVEEIKLDERLRDIIVDPSGRVVLWTDKHSVLFVEPLEEGSGSPQDEGMLVAVTASKCLACHVTADPVTHGIGPNLQGVMGRAVAGASGYQYSEALRRAGGVWDEQRLDEFLADPQRFAPGMKVEMQPVTDAAERRRAIRFLSGGN